jgi:hypothetical protein
MEPKHDIHWHLHGLALGLALFVFRISLVFAVIGAGYAIYEWFGGKWFFVYLFAVIAARLHFDLAWIERTHPRKEDMPAKQEQENPFRKR